jgi:hypothetical protein
MARAEHETEIDEVVSEEARERDPNQDQFVERIAVSMTE